MDAGLVFVDINAAALDAAFDDANAAFYDANALNAALNDANALNAAFNDANALRREKENLLGS